MQRGPYNIVERKTNILNEIHFRHQSVEIVEIQSCAYISAWEFQWLSQDLSWIEFLWKLPLKEAVSKDFASKK